jgi:hypothetical protein
MGPMRLLTLFAAGLLSVATAAPAFAAPRGASPPAQARAKVASPIAMTAVKDLDFTTLTVTSAGTATVRADTEALSTSGGVQRVIGTPSAAHFEIAAARFAVLLVRPPSSTLTLTRVGGTETMTVSNWTTNSGLFRIVPANGVLDIAVGGQLNVNANQAEGVYTGQFTILVDYF